MEREGKGLQSKSCFRVEDKLLYYEKNAKNS